MTLAVCSMHHRQQTDGMSNIFCNKKPLTAFFILLCCTSAIAQEGTIKGKISNGANALPFATVFIGNKTSITNKDGDFSITLSPGNYTLTVTHIGYKKVQQEIKIEEGVIQSIDIIMLPEEQQNETVVVGTRSAIQRSTLNTSVPVDVFHYKNLEQTGQLSVTQMLNFLAPSFNASREVLNEPATLRGLDPNHVLILVNGIRYHNMVSIFNGGLRGQLGRGSVSNDLNSIPVSAIEKIEVLRDGASAQYGSDAIAGVINIILKESINKTSIRVHTGQYYKGDGEKFSFGANHGISLNKKGFINFSIDFRNQEMTYRGGQYEGRVYVNNKREDDSIINVKGFDRRLAVDNIGNSEFISGGALVNGMYNINDRIELFWTASFNQKNSQRKTAYRFPRNTNQVITELYPDGFQPVSKPRTVDISTIGGIRGTTKHGWQWDISSSFGTNSISSYVSNTNNASQFALGKNAQTSFYSGKSIYNQIVNSLNFSTALTAANKKIKSANIAWGLEWRMEEFREKPGEESSWENYDPSKRTQAGAQGGAGNDTSLHKKRNEFGAYIDLETEFNNRFLLNAASRYEYYSDFGGNLAGKLAIRYKMSDQFSIRSSLSNGFRAPSLQQRYNSSISLGYNFVGPLPVPSARGTFPNDHPVVKALGVQSLTAEKTINLSVGLTSTLFKKINVTIDAYHIRIKDRIVFSSQLEREPNSSLDRILDQYPQFDQIDRVNLFCNAINTKTNGIDVVANGKWKFKKSDFGIMLAANFTKTSLFGKIEGADKIPSDTLFNLEERIKVEKGQPESKIILSLTWEKGKTKFILTNTRFGKTETTTFYSQTKKFIPENFSSKIITDFSINYSLKTWMTLTTGANNLFNIYPDKLKNYDNTATGIYIYSPEASPFGFNGGYYYVGLNFSF